jgi:hypothetical protein
MSLADQLLTLFDAFCDNASSFTCQEAEVIYDMYVEADLRTEAHKFMSHHADGDNDDSDDHAPLYDHNGYLSGWKYVDHDSEVA